MIGDDSDEVRTIAGTTEGGLSALGMPTVKDGCPHVPADASSSKLTPTVVYSDGEDVSDVETFKSDASSRLSSSRPASQLGPSRKSRKQMRTETRVRARKESLGLSFTDSTEYYRQRSIFPADGSHPSSEPSIAVKGSVATSMTDKQFTEWVVTRASSLALPQYALWKFCEMPPNWTPTFSSEVHKAEIEGISRSINALVVSQKRCEMCGVDVWGPHDTHLTGKRHNVSLSLNSRLDSLMGAPASGQRQYARGFVVPSSTEACAMKRNVLLRLSTVLAMYPKRAC